MSLNIVPLVDAPFGALVSGWEPTEPLTSRSKRSINEALHRHRLLVFRGQPQPSDQDLVRFVEAFGDSGTSETPLQYRDRPENYKSRLSGDVELKVSTLRVSFPVNPACFSIFFSNFQSETSV